MAQRPQCHPTLRPQADDVPETDVETADQAETGEGDPAATTADANVDEATADAGADNGDPAAESAGEASGAGTVDAGAESPA